MNRYNLMLASIIILLVFSFCSFGTENVESKVYGEISDNCESGMKELLGTVEDNQEELSDVPNIDNEILDEHEIQQETQVRYPESDDSFVLVKDYISDIYIDLKYASVDNFTGR